MSEKIATVSETNAGRVWLGGDTKSRSLVRVDRMERPEWVILSVFGACAAVVMFMRHSVWSFLVGALIAGVGWGLVVRVNLPTVGLDSSISLWVRTRISWAVRAWAGVRAGTGDVAPAGLGSILFEDVETPVGIVGVGEHASVADGGSVGAYFTATVETQGRARTSGAAWSSLLAHLSSESSPVSHVVQTARVMAWDSTDHVAWVAPLAAASPSADLVNSYAEVVDELARRASAQRTWVTFRIPLEEVTAMERTMTPAALVARVVADVVERADDFGIAMRPLSVLGRGALARHMMDPSMSPDDLDGITESWVGVWPSWKATDDGWCVDIHGAAGTWRASLWEVPASHIVPGWMSRDWLYQALRDVERVPVRTFVVAAEVQPRSEAAKTAQSDHTSDLAHLNKTQGTVSTGQEDAQAGSSAVRVSDLAPEMQAGGVRWSMAIGFHASPETWRDAARRMAATLEDCYIKNPVRLRYRQDQVLLWILGMGLAWKKGR